MSNLSVFAEYCQANKDQIVNLYNIVVRKDVGKKPVRQLREFLGLMGIHPRKLRTIKENGKKVYLYTVPAESVGVVRDIATRRADPNRAEDWHEERSRQTENRLFTKDNPLTFPRTYRTSMHGDPVKVLESVEKEW